MSVEDVRNHAFQPTRPLRGATRCPQFRRRISSDFNPRAPCGARRCKEYVRGSQCNYFNPRAPCGARREGRGRYQAAADISTHAPLAGRDASRPLQPMKRNSISTHAPLAGRDRPGACRSHDGTVFQPTRPLRGATRFLAGLQGLRHDFNPRAPCGARQRLLTICRDAARISTHAPLAGRDRIARTLFPSVSVFQPTRPLRGATVLPLLHDRAVRISTHAPLAGRDAAENETNKSKQKFQPTRPLRGATASVSDAAKAGTISTHAPLAGRDSKSVQITMHIFAITDKFQMLLHRMPPVRAFCSFLMQENHADFGCEPPK